MMEMVRQRCRSSEALGRPHVAAAPEMASQRVLGRRKKQNEA